MKVLRELFRTSVFCAGRIIYGDRKSSKVVYYHDVHESGRESYTGMSTCMESLRRHVGIVRAEGYTIVPEITEPYGQIQFAFDDGFRGIWDNRDYFIGERIYPTVFVAVSLIGRPGYLSEGEIRTLHASGFNIQSHGVSHTDMTRLDRSDLRKELLQSKSYFENLLGKTVDGVCFPCGYFSDAVCRESLAAGYTRLYSSIPCSRADRAGSCEQLYGRLFFQSLSPLQARLALRGGMKPLRAHYRKIHFRPDRTC